MNRNLIRPRGGAVSHPKHGELYFCGLPRQSQTIRFQQAPGPINP